MDDMTGHTTTREAATTIALGDLVDLHTLRLAIDAGWVKQQRHPTLALSIYNYTERCQYERAWSETTRATRGLIVDNETGQVVARPWAKFFNYGEPDAPPLDLRAAARVTDKVDGSLGILYGDHAVATRGSFTSDQAMHATSVLRSRYSEFTPPLGLTVLVEIVYPANRIVCDYGDVDDLILLGAVETASGQALGSDAVSTWPGPRTQVFNAASLAEALALPPRPGAEGLVVFVGSETVKLKQADYVALHRIVTGLNAKVVWEHIAAGRPVSALCEPLPDEFHPWILDCARGLQKQHNEVLVRSRQTHADILAALGEGWTRRDYAAQASRSVLRAWVFMLLDGKDPSNKIWQTLRPSGDVRPIHITEDAA